MALLEILINEAESSKQIVYTSQPERYLPPNINIVKDYQSLTTAQKAIYDGFVAMVKSLN